MAIDITFEGHPEGIDLEIVRALSDAITSGTPFCARFEEDDIFVGTGRDWDEDAA